MRILMSGNELGDYVDDGWAASAGSHNPTVNQPGGYTTLQGNGGQYYFYVPQNYAMSRPFYPAAAPISEFYIRFHFHGNSNTGGERSIFHLYDPTNATILFSLSVYDVGQPSSRLRFWKGDLYSGGSVISDSGVNFPNNVWTTVEMHIKMSVAGGIVEWKIGSTVGTVTVGNVTGPGGEVSVGNLWFFNRTVNNSTPNGLDDIAVNDTLGTANNSWVGDGYIVFIKPIANGTLASQLTNDYGTKVDNFAHVAKLPFGVNPSGFFTGSGPGAPGQASGGGAAVGGFVAPTAVNQQDTYVLPRLPLEAASIKAVQPLAYVQKLGPTPYGHVQPLLRVPGGLMQGAQVVTPLAPAWVGVIMDQNTFTTAPFTTADINAAEVGLAFKA